MDELTVYASADSWIQSNVPDTNKGSEDYLFAGDTASGESRNRRSVLKFDLSSIAGATILAVTLSLYEYDAARSGTAPASWAVELNRLLRDWVESEVTWNSYSSGNSWTTGGAGSDGNDIDADESATLTLDATPANDYVDWVGATLLDDVQKFVNGTYSNYGWRVAAPTAENQGAYYSYNAFYSTEKGAGYQPKLVISYTPAAALTRSSGRIIG